MDAKVKFTNEFKEMTKSKPSRRKLGELRYKKLKELDKNGELSMCRTRQEVADMLGIPGAKGKSFVSRAVYSGKLEEIIRGKDHQKPICEYHWAYKDLSYKQHEPVTTPVILSRAYDSEPKVLAKAKAIIKYTDGKEIILEGYAGEEMATIIKALR